MKRVFTREFETQSAILNIIFTQTGRLWYHIESNYEWETSEKWNQCGFIKLVPGVEKTTPFDTFDRELKKKSET